MGSHFGWATFIFLGILTLIGSLIQSLTVFQFFHETTYTQGNPWNYQTLGSKKSRKPRNSWKPEALETAKPGIVTSKPMKPKKRLIHKTTGTNKHMKLRSWYSVKPKKPWNLWNYETLGSKKSRKAVKPWDHESTKLRNSWKHENPKPLKLQNHCKPRNPWNQETRENLTVY